MLIDVIDTPQDIVLPVSLLCCLPFGYTVVVLYIYRMCYSDFPALWSYGLAARRFVLPPGGKGAITTISSDFATCVSPKEYTQSVAIRTRNQYNLLVYQHDIWQATGILLYRMTCAILRSM